VKEMRGKGLVLTVAHLLYDTATINDFVSIREITDFLEEPEYEVTSTMQVLHNIMVSITEKEYLDELKRVLVKLERKDSNVEIGITIPKLASETKTRYTLNPMVYSLIEKGIGTTPVFEALKIVVTQLLNQWEDSAAKGELTEFTSKLSAEHKEMLTTELCRRVALREGCELTEDEMKKLRRLSREGNQIKTIYSSKFIKSYTVGKQLGITITPSDVISYISVQLRRGELPGYSSESL
jgi:hypothetical protein